MDLILRRDFLKIAAVGGLSAGVSGLFGCSGSRIPSRMGKIIKGRKLNIACIGIGGKGAHDISNLSHENIVALCDVHHDRAQETVFKRLPDAKRYRDYRKMLIEMDEQIDAVSISTPDHTHFPAAMMAVTMGKHVFVQKPMSHTVEETRLLTIAAREHGVISQMGIQGHAQEAIRMLKEVIDAGAIGDVREVHIWTNRPVTMGPYAWKQGIARPSEVMPVPESLDWNLWLGVAPVRPYHSEYMPKRWRGWWDFGCCALGDMGCHMFDGPFWALNLNYPESVEAETSSVNAETGPEWSIITYKFPARGSMPPVKLVWYDGGRKPPRPKDLEPGRRFDFSVGMYMVGEKGSIMDTTDIGSSPRIIPECRMADYIRSKPEKTIKRAPWGSHYPEWTMACKGEWEMPGACFDYSGPLTETVLLGNVAIRAGKKIQWDATKMTCNNVPEAANYISKEYREF